MPQTHTIKCPKCGKRFKPPKPPVKYRGYLLPYLPMILRMLKNRKSPDEISDALKFKDEPHYGNNAGIRYIAKKYGIEIVEKEQIDMNARNKAIHAAYKTGDISLRKVGQLYGLSADRVRHIYLREERWKRGEE